MVISKRVIAREFLPKAAKLKVLRLEISERGWITTSTASLEGGASASEVVRNRQHIVDERRVAKQALFETVQALHARGLLEDFWRNASRKG